MLLVSCISLLNALMCSLTLVLWPEGLMRSKSRAQHESDSETLLCVDSIQGTQALWLDLNMQHINLISSVLCSANSRRWSFAVCRRADNTHHKAYLRQIVKLYKGFFFSGTYAEAVSYVRCVRGENPHSLFYLFFFLFNCKTELVSSKYITFRKCSSNTADAHYKSSLSLHLPIMAYV